MFSQGGFFCFAFFLKGKRKNIYVKIASKQFGKMPMTPHFKMEKAKNLEFRSSKNL